MNSAMRPEARARPRVADDLQAEPEHLQFLHLSRGDGVNHPTWTNPSNNGPRSRRR